MSEDIRPLEGFSPMRQMGPHYGGNAPGVGPSQGIGQGIRPVEGLPGTAPEPELAFNQEPQFTTAPSMQPPGAPEARLPHIMKLLEDPRYHNEFCTQFKEYIDQMNPDQKLMPPGTEGGMKMPGGGGGIPMIPGLGGGNNAQSADNAMDGSKAGQSALDDLNLTGSIEDRISQLQTALEQLEGQKSQLEGQIQQLEAEVQQLEAQLQELETQKKEIENQKLQKQQELNQAKQEQQKLQTQKQQLKAEESQLNGQKQQLNGQITTLGTQITQLTAQIGATRAQAGALHAQAAALLSNPYTAVAGAALEAQAVALDAQATAMEVQKNQLQMQKQQAECQLQQVEAQLQQNLSKQSQVDQQLQVVGNKVQKLEQEVAQLDQKLQQAEQKVAETRDRLNEKKKTLADKKAELAQVKLKIAKVKQKQQEHQAYKNKQEGNSMGQEGQGAGFGNPLSLLSAMGIGKPPQPGAVGTDGKPKELAESPGGPLNMRAGKPDAEQGITRHGPNPNKEQVGSMCEEVGARYGVPPEVMKAMAWNDSRFNAQARGEDGSKGAIHIDAGRNPDYDVARGNSDPAYNLEFGGYKMREHFERTSDWKMAADSFYGRDNPGQAMGSQIMALAASRPWEGSGPGMTAGTQNAAQRQGGRRG